MENKKIHIVAIQEGYLFVIFEQIKQVFGEGVIVQATTLKDLKNNTIKSGEVVLLSTEVIKPIVLQVIPEGCHCIVGKRDINISNIKELMNISPGKKILVINDTKSNTEETVSSLKETLFEHEYYPYNPEEPFPDNIDFIITPGEKHLLPSGLGKVIDIGPRILEISTFFELVNLFDIDWGYTTVVKRYIKALASLSDDLSLEEPKQKVVRLKDVRDVAGYTFSDVIAFNSSMKETRLLAEKFSVSTQPIHLQGELGTGKSMIAQAIHNASSYRNGPYVAVNCALKSIDMLEIELFGIEEKDTISVGLFEIANGGTLYIEDMGDIPLSIQGKILHAIEENEIIRTKGHQSIPVDVRIITSSTNSLEQLVEEGRLRSELYYHLGMCLIRIPSLSERQEDFKALIDDIKKRLKRQDIMFTPEVMAILKQHKWIGNVKELYNVISILSCLGEREIGINSLPLYLRPNDQKKHLFKSQLEENATWDHVISAIEEHGFLDESLEILRLFAKGKKDHTAYGRLTLKKLLEKKDMQLSEQQLRARLEVLHEQGLLIVRQGRAGTTISRTGEEFLNSTGACSYHPKFVE